LVCTDTSTDPATVIECCEAAAVRRIVPFALVCQT